MPVVNYPNYSFFFSLPTLILLLNSGSLITFTIFLFICHVCPFSFRGLKTLGSHIKFKHKQGVDLIYLTTLFCFSDEAEAIGPPTTESRGLKKGHWWLKAIERFYFLMLFIFENALVCCLHMSLTNYGVTYHKVCIK